MNNVDEKKVALLTLNYNAKEFIKSSVESILAQKYDNFELFVIHNLSSDGSADYVRKNYPKDKFPKVNLVAHQTNGGVGKGFNDVIRRIYKDFDYIALLDQDVKLDQNWLREAVGTLDKDENVYICTTLTLDWEGKVVDNAGGTIVNIFAGIFTGFLGDMKTEAIPPQFRKEDFPILFGIATAMLVRSSAFEEFGLYDEDFFMYFEEFDFSWRVILGGKKIICNPRALAYHFGHGSKPTKDMSLRLLKQTEINLLATYSKNLSWLYLVFILPPLFIARLLISLYYLPISSKITRAKISGLTIFAGRFITAYYYKKHLYVSRRRHISDRKAFTYNPTSVFTFKPILVSLLPWFKKISQVYHHG